MKNTKTPFSLSVVTLTLLLTACSGANSGSNTPEANNGANTTTTNTTASTGSPTPSLPVTTPGPELPIPAPVTPSQPANPAAAAIAALEANGTIPKLDRSESLAGPDLDGNGVRDDVDAWITQKYPSVKQRSAAWQMARAFQQSILVPANDRTRAKIVSTKVDRAIDCLNIQFPESAGSMPANRVRVEIRGLTMNTKSRLKSFLTYNKLLDGTTSSLSETSEAISCE